MNHPFSALSTMSTLFTPSTLSTSFHASSLGKSAALLFPLALMLTLSSLSQPGECSPTPANAPPLGHDSETSVSLPLPPLGLDDAMRLLEGARTLLEDRSSTPLLSASQETAPKTTGETPVLPSLSAGEETAPKTTGETPVLPSLSAGEETAPKTTGETPVLPSLSAGQECARLADACARYMDTIVAAQLGRVPYEWRVVGKRKRVSAGSATAREFNADNPVRDAMALRFRAFQSDVFVEQLVVQDASGESLTIRMGRWVRADFAQGGDTVFLDLPLTVSRIYATCRHDSPHPPRLGIEAGVPRVPDYAREIASLCRRAVQAIERQDWTESRDSLSRALRRLSQFHAGQGEQ